MNRLAVLLAVILLVAAPRPASVIPADSLGSGFLWVGVEPDLARTGAPTATVNGPPARGKGTPGDSGNVLNASGDPLKLPRLDPQGLDQSGPGYSVASGAPLIALGQGALTTGVASWYADPRKPQGSLYAAMPGYRKPFWVTVRYGSRSLRVRVSDACQCHVGRRDAKVIDLSWRAFSDPAIGLGVPLRRGIVKVTVEVIRAR